MSQAKVDRYKEEKRNREKIMKKQKREWMLTKIGLSVFGIVLVGWVGIAAYTGLTTEDTTNTTLPAYTVDTAAIDTYLTDLMAE